MSGKIVYYIINNEIKRHSGRVGSMSTGKTVAQVGHAAVRIFDTGKLVCNQLKNGLMFTTDWLTDGLPSKIFNGNMSVINDIMAIATDRDINYVTVRDAGRTQIQFASLTVLAIGPDNADILDPIVNELSEVK